MSFTDLVVIYIMSLLSMILVHAAFIASAGILLGSEHTGHLAAYGAFMTGASAVFLFLGLCSARGRGELVPIWHAALLVWFVLQTFVGAMRLGHVLDGPLLPFSLVSGGAIYPLSRTYVWAVTKAGHSGEYATFKGFARWVPNLSTTITPEEQRSASDVLTSEPQELAELGRREGKLQTWLSRMIHSWRQQSITESAPITEKERLLSIKTIDDVV